jgi:hypothetical protein
LQELMREETRKNAAVPSRRQRRPGRVLLFSVAAAIGISGLIAVVAVVNNRTAELSIPTHNVPADSALPALQQAGLLGQQMAHRSPYSMPLKAGQRLTAADYANCAKDAGPTIAAVHAALKLPFVARPIRSAKEFSLEFASLRELTRILAGTADHYEIVGDYGRAMDIRLDALELGMKVPHGGALLPELVGVAIQAIGIVRIEELIPNLSEAELAHAASRLDDIEANESSYKEIVMEEGYTSTAYLKELFQGFHLTPEGINEMHSAFGNGAMRDMNWRAKIREVSMMSTLVLTNKHSLLEASLKYSQDIAKETEGAYRPAFVTRFPVSLGAMSFDNMLHGGWEKHLSMQAVRRILRTEIALQRYRKARGTYPQSLDALVPSTLSSVPVDPFSPVLAPLRYTRTPQGFVVYSIGPDMQDDSGKPSQYAGSMGGDIVSGYLAGARKRAPLPTPTSH